MGDKREKNKQEYEEEIARLVAAGKRLMAEADEIISAQTGTRTGTQMENKPSRHHKRDEENRQAPRISQEQQAGATHLGFWGNLCAMFMGHKLSSMTFEDDKTTKGVSDDFDHDSIDECIEEEEEF